MSLAKYPFLKEAGNYLRESGFNWEELDKPYMNDIINRAVERIEIGVSGGIYDKLEKYEVEVLTFLVSLIIIKSIGAESLLRKYSLAEARRAEKFLVEDIKDRKESEKRSMLSNIFDELFALKIDVVEHGRFYKISVIDYLIRSTHFHEQEWKLINRLVHNGYVYLDADETVRLIRSELATMIHDRVKVMTLPALPKTITLKVEELRTRLVPTYEYRTQVVSEYPPCIKHAIEIMNKGENLPHSGRVMLATYMLGIGRSVEEVIPLFQNAPDFNEKITRYQLEHLAGVKGSRTKYSVPSCEKIRINNLCFATTECNGIINPIQFGRRLRKDETSGNKQ